MKTIKKDDLLLRSIEGFLEQYRRNELDGSVIDPAVIPVKTFQEALSGRALLFIQKYGVIAKA